MRHQWEPMVHFALPTQRCRKPKCMLVRRTRLAGNGKPMWNNGGYPTIHYGFVEDGHFVLQFSAKVVPECRG